MTPKPPDAKVIDTHLPPSPPQLQQPLAVSRGLQAKTRGQPHFSNGVALFVCQGLWPESALASLLDWPIVPILPASSASPSPILDHNTHVFHYVRRSKGFRIIRFWNDDALKQTDAVLEEILRQLHAPHPDPLPASGAREETSNAQRTTNNVVAAVLK